ncbi:MAG: NAD-dependent epimerase/dehydratase family protein [Candidatus Gracilibacteria bacterium]
MQNKTILLTGGTGFLGSHLLERLINDGYKVILLKRTNSNLSKINGLIDKIKFYDIDKLEKLELVFENHKINSIIHTSTDYGRREGDFNKIIDANLLFPIKLLELGIKYGINTFINSDTFWDDNMELPIGLSYYAYSKKDFIKYSKKLIEKSNIKFINIKLEHLYGPKDNESKFIPYIINSLLKNVESIDLTEGKQKKDFIYINDAINAYIYILNNVGKINISFEEFDLGIGKTLSIKELLLKINNIIKANTLMNFGKLIYRKGEAMESKANIEKLNNFGWQYEYDIDRGILETINYFKFLLRNNGK